MIDEAKEKFDENMDNQLNLKEFKSYIREGMEKRHEN